MKRYHRYHMFPYWFEESQILRRSIPVYVESRSRYVAFNLSCLVKEHMSGFLHLIQVPWLESIDSHLLLALLENSFPTHDSWKNWAFYLMNPLAQDNKLLKALLFRKEPLLSVKGQAIDILLPIVLYCDSGFELVSPVLSCLPLILKLLFSSVSFYRLILFVSFRAIVAVWGPWAASNTYFSLDFYKLAFWCQPSAIWLIFWVPSFPALSLSSYFCCYWSTTLYSSILRRPWSAHLLWHPFQLWPCRLVLQAGTDSRRKAE